MGLLIGDADQVGQLLLGQAQHDPTLANPRADMAIDILSAPGRTTRRRRPVRRVAILAAFASRLDAWVLLGHLGPLDKVVSSGSRSVRTAYMASGNADASVLRVRSVCRTRRRNRFAATLRLNRWSAIGRASCVKF